MSEPFLAEVRMVGFNFAPRGWAFCDGQILPINQNQSLYSLLGTTYGGDGRTSFALPDLRGRTPLHVGNGHTLGQRSGEETHTLTANEMPQHSHSLQGSNDAASAPVPQDNLAGAATLETYGDVGTAPVAMNAGTVANAGGSQAHENMQPWLAVRFCIALQGLFPSRN
ncbi:tail fiber protein [Halomonas denitrificans]|nr:tail fiber protein [Halomonas denitrificans]